jgi:hypothetical protein
MKGVPQLPIRHILLGLVTLVPIRKDANLTKISCAVVQLQSQTPASDACFHPL